METAAVKPQTPPRQPALKGRKILAQGKRSAALGPEKKMIQAP